MADVQLTEEQIRRQTKINTYRRNIGTNRYHQSYRQRMHESFDEYARENLNDLSAELQEALDTLHDVLEDLHRAFGYACTARYNGTVNAFEEEMDSLLEEMQGDLDALDAYEDDEDEE